MAPINKLSPFEDMMRLIDSLIHSGRHNDADTVVGNLLQSHPLSARGLSIASQVKQRNFDLVSAESLGRMAVICQPGYWQIYANYSKVRALLANTGVSIKILRRCSIMAPDVKSIQTQLGLMHLAAGHWRTGLKYYENRDSRTKFNRDMEALNTPIWQGENIAGKKFLLVGEQGAGDIIQFIRFACHLAERGAHVTVSCAKELHEIIASAKGVSRVVGSRVSRFDYAEIIMSLPYKLDIDEKEINFSKPYLFTKGRGYSLPKTDRFRVGICWAGNPKHKNDWARSIPFPLFAPLFALEGVEFFSLQVGERAEDIAEGDAPIKDLSPYLNSFADTAKVIEQLDLVISIDSSVAHLAGALGKPIWTLLSRNGEWRWMRATEHSPWYPSMRLFWQSKLGDWLSALDQVCTALKEESQAKIRMH